jgi:predicted nucleic acid-binding protein
MLSVGGSPAQALALAWRSEFEVYYCPPIFAEYERVLNRPKFKLSRGQIDGVLNKVSSLWINAVPPRSSVFAMDDNTDRIFYDTAKHYGAILVTGNLKHYPRESPVMNPHDFLEYYRQRANDYF